MANKHPIRLALIGAGIFARDVHLPALLKRQDQFEITAIYSRTESSAASLARQVPHPVEIYTDSAALLARDDVEAVDILLPIDVMPDFIRLALQAGKHVISEKPIAPDLATGRQLVASYAEQAGQVWLVGENWRYEDAFRQAAEIVHAGQIGRPLLCHWALHIPITPENKYYHTTWRRSGVVPGGFLLDVGVHHVAALRMLLGEIAEVSAVTREISADLPPVDTLAATFRFESGLIGTYLITFATQAPWPPALHVTGDNGSLRVYRRELQLTRDGSTRNIPVTAHQGVAAELAAFAAAIRRQQPHRNSPQEALQDLAVIEALVRSAEAGRSVTPERIVGSQS